MPWTLLEKHKRQLIGLNQKADNAQQTADAALSAGNASGESAAAAMLAAKKHKVLLIQLSD